MFKFIQFDDKTENFDRAISLKFETVWAYTPATEN